MGRKMHTAINDTIPDNPATDCKRASNFDAPHSLTEFGTKCFELASLIIGAGLLAGIIVVAAEHGTDIINLFKPNPY